MPVFIYNSLYFGPILGQLGNDVYGFLGGLTGTVSIANLAAIALDRYYVIVQPLDPGRRISRLRARLCVLVTWVYGASLASCPLLGLSRYTPEGLLTSSSFDYLNTEWSNRTFILCFFVAAWVIPFCIITLSYLGIYRIVERATQRGQAGSSRHCREHDKRRTEVRLAVVAGVVVALWFVAWTPYAVVALLGVSGRPPGPLASMLPALFCKTASCLDPYVYAVTHPRFRRELAKLCGRTGIATRRPAKMRARSRLWRGDTSLTSAATATVPRRTSVSSDDVGVEEEVVPVMMVDFRRRGEPGESVCSTSSLQDSPPPVGPQRGQRDESRSSSSGEPPPQAARVVSTPVMPAPPPPAPPPVPLSPLQLRGDCPACPQVACFPMTAADQLRYRAPSVFTSPRPRRSKSFSLRASHASKLTLSEAVLPAVLQDPISV